MDLQSMTFLKFIVPFVNEINNNNNIIYKLAKVTTYLINMIMFVNEIIQTIYYNQQRIT